MFFKKIKHVEINTDTDRHEIRVDAPKINNESWIINRIFGNGTFIEIFLANGEMRNIVIENYAGNNDPGERNFWNDTPLTDAFIEYCYKKVINVSR